MYGEGLDPLFPEGPRALSFAAVPESMKDQANTSNDEEKFHTFFSFLHSVLLKNLHDPFDQFDDPNADNDHEDHDS